jgi:4-hydroxybenzoate polyprenyltransferase
MGIRQRVATWGSLVKFSHSIFALPFALIMVLLISRERPLSALSLSMLVVCIVAARTAAMGFNRLVDVEIDKANPRTKNREIPSGVVTKREAAALVVSACAVFVTGSAMLGVHCLVLAPVVLVVLLGYSYVKRFSSICHVVLGIALALAPGGVWYALTAEWSWRPVPLMGAVALWVAGFDILYSCQDEEFDRGVGLFSVPSMIGVTRAVRIAALLHLFAVAMLVWSGSLFHVGIIYYLGVALFAALLLSQYLAIILKGISCIDQVFFTRNGAASVLLLLSVLIDAF